MVATSRRLMWKSGSKKSMPPNTLIRNQSIIEGTRVPDTTSLTTPATIAVTLGFKACRPRLSTCAQGRRMERLVSRPEQATTRTSKLLDTDWSHAWSRTNNHSTHPASGHGLDPWPEETITQNTPFLYKDSNRGPKPRTTQNTSFWTRIGNKRSLQTPSFRTHHNRGLGQTITQDKLH